MWLLAGSSLWLRRVEELAAAGLGLGRLTVGKEKEVAVCTNREEVKFA